MIVPDAIVDVSFLATENGGRRIPTQDHGRYGVPVRIENNVYDSWILLDGVGPLLPGGEYKEIPIKFADPEMVRSIVRVGSKFDLWEFRINTNDWGVVGFGTIVKLV